MNLRVLLSFCLSALLMLGGTLQAAAPAPVEAQQAALSNTNSITAKQAKRLDKVTDRIESLKAKMEGKKQNAEKWRSALVWGIVAIALSVVASIIAFAGIGGALIATLLWTLSSIAWIVALVFLVMWLVEELG